MGEAEEEGAQSQTGFIRLVICPYKEGRSESLVHMRTSETP